MTTDVSPRIENKGASNGIRRVVRLLRPANQVTLGLLGFLVVTACWYVFWLAGFVNQQLVPRPDELVSTAWTAFTEQSLAVDVLVSIRRVIVGVAIGTTLAVPVGFALSWYRRLRFMAEPLLNFARALPPIALIPLVIVYLGIGESARVSILVLASFFAPVVVIHEGVSSIDQVYIRAARTLGASEWDIFRRVVVRLLVPQYFVAVRVALGISWATLVAAELIAAQTGLGAVIKAAGNFFQIEMVYVGILLIGAVALGMDYAIKALLHKSVAWQDRVAR